MYESALFGSADDNTRKHMCKEPELYVCPLTVHTHTYIYTCASYIHTMHKQIKSVGVPFVHLYKYVYMVRLTVSMTVCLFVCVSMCVYV